MAVASSAVRAPACRSHHCRSHFLSQSLRRSRSASQSSCRTGARSRSLSRHRRLPLTSDTQTWRDGVNGMWRRPTRKRLRAKGFDSHKAHLFVVFSPVPRRRLPESFRLQGVAVSGIHDGARRAHVHI
eukprot:scaffold45461_cov62-Phaeocystis_antarctica.AAC.2